MGPTGAGGASEWNCLRLAGATWTTTQDRAQTLEWRREAALAGSAHVFLEDCPELAAVAADPEFVAAARHEGLPRGGAG